MPNELDATEYSRRWVAAWNARDVAAVLEHFHDDVVFSSPLAAQLFPETGGVVRGKDALREYWGEGLKRLPGLHFTVEAVYAGIDTVVINYRNHRGQLVNEVLVFDGGLVREGHATYLRQDA
ncbi:nuclear transport factor 2 family protein [Catellatospora sp. NPDC049111]|uniref:nuclear transport factor 2 family protein n=1 Tax=Catellatospora sp. NPDC049111 TaxID=3155271 RepID=UPI00340E4C13